MKIAMMTPWNVACRVSIHAELLGEQWVKHRRVIEDERCKAIKKATNECVEANSAEKVARRFIGLFKEINAGGDKSC